MFIKIKLGFKSLNNIGASGFFKGQVLVNDLFSPGLFSLIMKSDTLVNASFLNFIQDSYASVPS